MRANDEHGAPLRVPSPVPHRHLAARTAAVMLGLSLVGGCSPGGAETRAAVDVASAFETALENDPAAACSLLAPGTRESLEDDAGDDCTSALQDAVLPESGQRLGATVAGHSAQVRFAGETVFLARFDDGWRVVAAGCERVTGDLAVPYDCDVEAN